MAIATIKRPEHHKDHGDHDQGDGNRHNVLAHNLASQYSGQLGDVDCYAPCLIPRHKISQHTGVQAHFRNKRGRISNKS